MKCSTAEHTQVSEFFQSLGGGDVSKAASPKNSPRFHTQCTECFGIKVLDAHQTSRDVFIQVSMHLGKTVGMFMDVCFCGLFVWPS